MPWGLIARSLLRLVQSIPWSKLPWETIVPILFDIFSAIFGKGLLGFAYELIGAREVEKSQKVISGAGAEAINVGILERATQNSPGLANTWCKQINGIAYARWVLDNAPDKWDEWRAGLEAWIRGDARVHYESTDYMKLYRRGWK